MKYIYINIQKIKNKTLNTFYENLNIVYKTKINKILTPQKRKQSIAGLMLLNILLNSEYNLNLNDLKINYNKCDKPYIKDKNIFFNISHSFDYVICAISDKEIGVDIEKIRNTNIKNIKWFATPKEQEFIMKSKNINLNLFKLYTLKEAYFKMKGTNLNNLLNVEFDLKNDKSDTKSFVHHTKKINDYIFSIIEKK